MALWSCSVLDILRYLGLGNETMVCTVCLSIFLCIYFMECSVYARIETQHKEDILDHLNVIR